MKKNLRHIKIKKFKISKWLMLCLIILNVVMAQAQKGDYMWIAGSQKNYTDLGGYDGHIMDFKFDTLLVNYHNSPVGIARYKASICDNNGNLLFYTNGRAVVNANKEIVSNAIDINDGDWARRYWPNPYGGFPGDQDVLILPDPKSNSGYYMLHKLPVYNPPAKDSFEIRYSYIKQNGDVSESEITIKNEKFYPKNDLLYSYLTAIRHTNQKDWWILQPLLGTSILTLLLDNNGININKIQASNQIFDKPRSSSSGSAKFSPDGTKYAIYNYYDQLQVYDFDRSTGLLSNHHKIFIIPEAEIDRSKYVFSSVEWSPNSRYIYTATQDWLHQIDTKEPDPDKRIVLIDTYNGTLDPFTTSFFLMAQGPDCKIYMSPANGSYSLHVINKPNEHGKACDFVQNGIKLPNSNGGSLPNFPRFRVDEVEKCDPGITSVFGEQVYYRRPLQVYPNPTPGMIHFQDFLYPKSCKLMVSDIHGKMFFSTDILADQLPEYLDISHLPSGRYNIDIYPVENKDRVFYGTQVVKM